ncbi:DUF3592 domain-containing protein [Oxalobacteraceae bacterium A2-2]
MNSQFFSKRHANQHRIIILIGLLFLCYAGIRLWEKWHLQNWHRTIAILQESKIDRREGRGPHYCLNVKYDYMVNGVTYEGVSTSPMTVTDESCRSNRDDAVELMIEARQQNPFFIYYDAQNPSNSAWRLEAVNSFDILLLAIGFFVLILGAVVLPRFQIDVYKLLTALGRR